MVGMEIMNILQVRKWINMGNFNLHLVYKFHMVKKLLLWIGLQWFVNFNKWVPCKKCLGNNGVLSQHTWWIWNMDTSAAWR